MILWKRIIVLNTRSRCLIPNQTIALLNPSFSVLTGRGPSAWKRELCTIAAAPSFNWSNSVCSRSACTNAQICSSNLERFICVVKSQIPLACTCSICRHAQCWQVKNVMKYNSDGTSHMWFEWMCTKFVGVVKQVLLHFTSKLGSNWGGVGGCKPIA